MLMPQRPDDNAPIWTALRLAVVAKRDFLVVRAGVAAPPETTWNDDEADRLQLRLGHFDIHGLVLGQEYPFTGMPGAQLSIRRIG